MTETEYTNEPHTFTFEDKEYETREVGIVELVGLGKKARRREHLEDAKNVVSALPVSEQGKFLSEALKWQCGDDDLDEWFDLWAVTTEGAARIIAKCTKGLSVEDACRYWESLSETDKAIIIEAALPSDGVEVFDGSEEFQAEKKTQD